MAKKKPKQNQRWSASEYASARGGKWLELISVGMFGCMALGVAGMFEIIPKAVAWTAGGVGAVILLACVPIMISRRNRSLSRFTPSTITDVYDRTATIFNEHQRPWLTQGMHSRAWLVRAPEADPERAPAAVKRLDKALQDVVAPLKPEWYRRVEKTGYLILFVPGVIVFAGCLSAGVEWGATFAATVFAMWIIGYPLAGGLSALARSQAARQEDARARPVLDETDPVVRPFQPANLHAVTTVIGNDGDEVELHSLAFRAAGTDADADQAAERLLELTSARTPAHD